MAEPFSKHHIKKPNSVTVVFSPGKNKKRKKKLNCFLKKKGNEHPAEEESSNGICWNHPNWD